MKFDELKNKTEKQLRDLLDEKRNEVRALKFKASEGQLKKISSVCSAKKTIAQVLTLLNVKNQDNNTSNT